MASFELRKKAEAYVKSTLQPQEVAMVDLLLYERWKWYMTCPQLREEELRTRMILNRAEAYLLWVREVEQQNAPAEVDPYDRNIQQAFFNNVAPEAVAQWINGELSSGPSTTP